MSTTTATQRLAVRLGAEKKEIIARAADLLGQSISTFTVSTLVQEAQRVTQRFGHLELSDRDRDAFLAALDHAPKPNAKLRKASRNHAKKVAP